MKRLLAVMCVMALCVGTSFAGLFGDADNQPNQITNGTFSTTRSTPSAVTAELLYVIIETTGSVAAGTLQIAEDNTVVLSITLTTSAGTKIVDLTRTPIKLDNIEVLSNVTDAGISYTLIYRKVIN